MDGVVVQAYPSQVVYVLAGHCRRCQGEFHRVIQYRTFARAEARLAIVHRELLDQPVRLVRINKKNITQPVPVVLDTKLRISPGAKIFEANESVVIATASSDESKIRSLEKKGASVIKIRKNKDGMVSFPSLLRVLGKMGISSILIEGGSTVSASAIKSGIVDKILFFYSPRLIGGDGISMIGPLGKNTVKNAINLRDVSYKKFNDEIMVEGYI